MAEPIEQRLAEIFREDAGRAPELDTAAPERVVRTVRRRRAGWVLAASLTVAALALTPVVMRDDPAARGGPLPDSGLSDCLPPESLAAVAARTLSFDGTVTAIAVDTSRDVPTATVTFEVNEWFRGGSGPTATATMQAPLPPHVLAGEAGPVYEIGTRLLVSGDTAAGRATAWGCGYTRYYDDRTAAAWRQAVRGG
ncbi:hypothetical protein [Symbioplanes lichenis]|uniref:hypothetical protein n=1 Tax=Symbioplanes lichenis TaxID=1629072 RepID=UPI002739C1AE|nr:hypothetical protein [Actinoplanes lichenis]